VTGLQADSWQEPEICSFSRTSELSAAPTGGGGFVWPGRAALLLALPRAEVQNERSCTSTLSFHGATSLLLVSSIHWRDVIAQIQCVYCVVQAVTVVPQIQRVYCVVQTVTVVLKIQRVYCAVQAVTINTERIIEVSINLRTVKQSVRWHAAGSPEVLQRIADRQSERSASVCLRQTERSSGGRIAVKCASL
jgi:hypothetical protein